MDIDVDGARLMPLERPLVLLGGLLPRRRVVEAGGLAVARLVGRVLELDVDFPGRVDVAVAVRLANGALPLLDLVLHHVAQLDAVGPGLRVEPLAGPAVALAEGGGPDSGARLGVGRVLANVVLHHGRVVVDVGLVAGLGDLDDELGHGHFNVELDNVCQRVELHVSVKDC